MKAKRRVDQALIQDGLIEEITRAQALIMAGKVYLGEQKIDKPGHLVACDAVLTVRSRPPMGFTRRTKTRPCDTAFWP